MSDLKLTIRRAVPDDAAAYALILGDDSVFPGTLQLPYPTEPLWKERLTAKANEGDIHLVAESDNEIVAHAMLWSAADEEKTRLCSRYLRDWIRTGQRCWLGVDEGTD